MADVIDGALHANIVIGTLDVRGLYVPGPGGDASDQNSINMIVAAEEVRYVIAVRFRE